MPRSARGIVSLGCVTQRARAALSDALGAAELRIAGQKGA